MYFFLWKEWKSKWIAVKTTFHSVKKTSQVVETFKATVSKLQPLSVWRVLTLGLMMILTGFSKY